MAETSMTPSRPRGLGESRRFTWLMGLVSFGLLAFFIVQVVIGFTTSASLHRLQLVQEVVLPGIIVPPKGYDPIQTVRSDHFDFQALDPQTGRLFIAHPGPSDVKLDQLIHQLPEGTQIKGSIVVVDTKRNEYVTSIDLPHIHGLVIAPDLHKVYAAGSIDDVVYSIDERTLKSTRIDVAPNCKSHKDNPPAPCENPDSLAYDPVNQKIFVSSPDGQNQVVIDTQTDKVTETIGLTKLGGDKWGDDIAHTRYDPASQRLFVVVQPRQQNPNDPNSPWPPAKLVTIDPVTESILQSLTLPVGCINAHGLGIDSQQQVAFVACIDSQNVVMVDLRTLKPIGDVQQLKSVGFKPDIVALDNKLHILYVGCASGISVFDESGASRGSLKWLKDYIISSSSSHSIAVDDDTHNIYVPLTDVGGRPVLWIEQYNPKGSV